jgi:site-specific DNA recombinase
MKKNTRLTVQSPPPPLGGDITAESIRVGLYLRVSTGHQVEGESLEEQESELRKYCAYRGFKIHQVYIEKGKSGGNTNRPEYQALIRDIEAKKLSAIIVKKLDRLSRSLLDFESLMVLLQRRNVDFISLREQFDTTNAMGKAMLRIALVFAQLEREQTSERISDVMVHRASKGMYNGGVTPFGYVCVNKEWQPDKKEKPILEFIFKTFIQTRSTVATTAILNRDGITNRRGQMWDSRRILDLLKNPVYIGSRRWKKQLFPGTHPPIISTQQFEQTQAFLKTIPQITATRAPFQRLLICGDCLSPMTPSYSLNRSKCRYYYYRCSRRSHYGKTVKTCSIKAIAFIEIEKRITTAFQQLGTPDHLKAIENKVIKHNHCIDATAALLIAEIDHHTQQLAKLKARQEQFLDSLIIPNLTTIDRKRINEKLEELDTEIKQVQAIITKKDFELTQKTDEQFNLTAIKQSISACLTLDTADPTAYRDSLRHLIQDITIYPTKLTFQFRWMPWPWEIDA